MFKSPISGRIPKLSKRSCGVASLFHNVFTLLTSWGIYVQPHWRRSVQHYIIGELLSKQEFKMHPTKNISVFIYFPQVCKAFIVFGSYHIRCNLFQFLCNNANLYSRYGNVLMYYTHKIRITSRSVKCPCS